MNSALLATGNLTLDALDQKETYAPEDSARAADLKRKRDETDIH